MTNDKRTNNEIPKPQRSQEEPSGSDTATQSAVSDDSFPTWPSRTMRVDDLTAFAALSIPPQLREIYGDVVLDKKLKALEETELLLVLREDAEMAFVRFKIVALEENKPGLPVADASQSPAHPSRS